MKERKNNDKEKEIAVETRKGDWGAGEAKLVLSVISSGPRK
jgi:hypothetical protein